MKVLVILVIFFFPVHLNAQSDTLYIQYSDSVAQWFEDATRSARSAGIITPEEKIKQSAVVRYKNASCLAKIRLKGDWVDHIEEDRWSLRVRLREGNVFGASRFSLVLPETRGGRKEYEMHRSLQEAGILTTHYTFVTVVVNGENWGLMAFEEHFDEALITRNKRPAGPILKFEEDAFWECQQVQTAFPGTSLEYPLFEAADIVAFAKKSTRKSTLLTARFEEGRAILESWRKGDFPVDHLDLPKFARYYALCDLFGFYHGLQWHNQRFYYRQSDQKIEPIAYDCYAEDALLIGKPLLGIFDAQHDTVYSAELWFTYRLFNVPAFVEMYNAALQRTLDRAVWKDPGFDPELKKRIEGRVGLLQKFLEGNDPEGEQVAYYPRAQWKADHPDVAAKYQKALAENPLPSASLKVERIGDRWEVHNYHHKDLIVDAHLDSGNRIVWKNELRLAPGQHVTLAAMAAQKLFAHTDQGVALPYKIVQHTEVNLAQGFTHPREVFRWQEGWVAAEKELTLNTTIIIGQEENLNLSDCALSFGPEGKIICYGECRIRNCTFTGSGTGNSGLRLLGPHTWIELSSFKDFTVDSLRGNGPLEFVNTDVRLEEVSLENITAADALHFAGCLVELDQVRIRGCSGDAIDMDYCKGYLKYVELKDIGDDGLDFSGCEAHIMDINVSACGDKGISIGEASQAEALKLYITGCEIGIAVKDASSLLVHQAPKISACPHSIMLYRKKDFYEKGGTLKLNGLVLEYLVEMDGFSERE